MKALYYTAPSDKVFEEVKEKAIELWKEVDTDNEKYGYASSKINRIKDLENIEDNLMCMVNMFDCNNQSLFLLCPGRLCKKAGRLHP